MTADSNPFAVASRQLKEQDEQIAELVIQNGILKLENVELRRTVEDLKARLKAPPY